MPISPFPILKTQRLILRQIIQEDLENIYKGLSNPQVIKQYGVSYDSLEATQEQMLWFKNQEETQSGIWWAICDLKDQTFYGACGFNDKNAPQQKAEIGFWLLPQFWGKGFITEALPAISTYAFEKLHLNRIEAFVETENTPSKKVLEKMNFVKEGTMHEYEVKNGRSIDLDLYALLKKD